MEEIWIDTRNSMITGFTRKKLHRLGVSSEKKDEIDTTQLRRMFQNVGGYFASIRTSISGAFTALHVILTALFTVAYWWLQQKIQTRKQAEPALFVGANGTFHLVDNLLSRQILWSFETKEPIYSAHHSQDCKFYIDYGMDSNLYSYKTQFSFFEDLRKLVPGDVKDFINRQPIEYSDGGHLYSVVNTSKFLLDFQTGQQMAETSDHGQLICVKRVDHEYHFYSTTHDRLWYLKFSHFEAWYEYECKWTLRMREHIPYVTPYITVYHARNPGSLKLAFEACGILISSQTQLLLDGTTANSDEEMVYDSDDDNIYESPTYELLVTKKQIGKGNNDTIVFEGKYDDLDVAVKRITKINSNHGIETEVQNLRKLASNLNVVRFHNVEYCSVEYHTKVAYLVFERCICSLHDVIFILKDKPDQVQHLTTVDLEAIKSWNTNDVLKKTRNIVKGLVDMHEKGIIHGNINPHNVLIAKDLSLKISGMGNSECPDENDAGYGSKDKDLYNLGRVLLFCKSGGEHQFCDTTDDSNNRDLKTLEGLSFAKDNQIFKDDQEAYDIISKLLTSEPDERPRAAQVSSHFLYWSPKRRILYLVGVAGVLNALKNDGSALSKALESIHKDVLSKRWDEIIDTPLFNVMNDYKKMKHQKEYRPDSVCDLLKFIRNSYMHYLELRFNIQDILGSVPEEFEFYFRSRFPELLMKVYKVCASYGWEKTPLRHYHIPS